MAKTISRMAQLKPDPNNANRGTARGAEVISKSIEELGAGRSVVADTNGVLIAGNKTVEAARKAGMGIEVVRSDGSKLIVVQRTDLDLSKDEKAKRLAIYDNRAGELSLEWDPAILNALDQEINLDGLFTEDEMAAIIRQLDPVPELQGDVDAVPEPPAKARTKPGQMYALGNHRLLCGDSTNAAQIAKLMGGKLAQLCWTDPPYNVEIVGGSGAGGREVAASTRKAAGGQTIQNDKMSDEAFDAFLAEVHARIFESLAPGAALYVAHPDMFGEAFRRAYRQSGMELKQTLVWVKNSLVMGRQDYQSKHEQILYGWKPGAAHKWYTDRKQTTILEFDRPTRSTDHPTMKPVALVEYCIGNSSAPGDLVLDPFGGSGTTLIACEASGRLARIMELDPKYCDVIVRRWEELTGKKAELVRA